MLFLKNISTLKIFITICCFLQINSYYFQNVHFLISAKLNGTSPFISLKELEPKSNYVNFIFDFEYHINNIPDAKNTAYFKISTNLDIPEDDELTENSITYRFFQDDWTKIKEKNIARNISYEKVKILSKEKNDEDDSIFEYYFKIKSEGEKYKSLMIKVPTQNKKEGLISIENILSLK